MPSQDHERRPPLFPRGAPSLPVLGVVALAVLAFARGPAAAGESSKVTTVESPRVSDGSGPFGIAVYYTQQVTKTWTCDLGGLSATCHGCTGACGQHYRKIERKDIEKRADEEIRKETSSSKIEGVLKTALSVAVKSPAGKAEGSGDVGGDSKTDSSSSDETKTGSESTTVSDVEMGTKSHAPKCWTWKVTGTATLTLTVNLTRRISSYNFLVDLGESVEEEVEGSPVAAVSVETKIDETNCCCASRMDPSAGSTPGAAGGSPDRAPEPPKKGPAKTGGGRTDPQTRAADYLGTLNGPLVAALPSPAREGILAGIRASAASRGIDLESLGDWKADFLAGAFDAPAAAPSAQYLGRSGAEERFVVPERFAPGGKPAVSIDGRPVPEQDIVTVSAKGGEPFTLVSIRREPSPRPAVITVLAPSGTSYTGEKPADAVEVASSTTIRRGPSTTVITVVPTVETRAPDGRTDSFDPTRNPAGGTPAYTAKDDSGFWSTLFQGLNVAASVLVPLGTTLLLKPDEGGNSAVRTEGDASLRVEVPNERYDAALAEAQKANPSFTSQSAASSLQAGLSSAAVGQGRGITVTSALVPGGATSSLRTGDTVVLSVSVDPAVAPSFRPGTVQVALADAGRPVGYMPVHDVFLDPQTRRGAVSASLPPGLTSSSGALLATVVCGSASSNPVELRLDPGEVEVVAIQKTALSGTAVQVKLVNRNGGRILGTLSLAGPGNFPGGGTTAKFDAWGTAFALIQTTDPGAITLTFTPDPAGGAAGMGKMFG